MMTKGKLKLIPASVLLLLAMSFYAELPAFATRVPADFKNTLEKVFSISKIRLDGSLELTNGELYVPVVTPQALAKKKNKGELEETFPSHGSPSVVAFNNGWYFLRVLHKNAIKTVITAQEMPEKLRKQILAAKFPADLIVPEHFIVPRSLKPILGDLSVTLVDDNSLEGHHGGVIADKTAVASASGHAPGHGTPGHQVPAHDEHTAIASDSAPSPLAHNMHELIFMTSIKSGSVILLDGKTLNKIAEFPTEGTPCDMVMSNGKLFIADLAKNRVLIMDPIARKYSGQIDLPAKSAPKSLAAQPHGAWLYVAGSASNDVSIVELGNHKVLMRTKLSPGPGKLALTPSGNNLLVLNVPSGIVSFISTLNNTVIGTLKVGSLPTSIAISHDGKTAYVSNRGSNFVTVIDIAKRQALSNIPTGSSPTGLLLSPDGSKLIVAVARDNVISIFNTKDHTKIKDLTLPMEVDFPGQLALLADHKRVLVTSVASNTIAVFDLDSLQITQQSAVGTPTDHAISVAVPE
jgi:YVTN family beta-propeller protein